MNTTNHVITFETNGTARCLWTETVPLHQLGRLNVHRASQVEFNPGQPRGIRTALNISPILNRAMTINNSGGRYSEC